MRGLGCAVSEGIYPWFKNVKPKFFYGYIMVLATFLTMMVMWGSIYTFGVFFKPLLTEFGWTRAETSGAHSLFMVLHGLLCIVTGRLNDRFGPRMVMTACGFFFGLGYLLMSQITAVWQLYLFYGVIVGISMSGGFVPLVSTIARWFVKKRGLMTGIAVSGIGAGTMVVPPIANWLISSYDWRISYIVIGSISLVLIVLAAQFLRRDPSQMGQLPYGADAVKEEGLNLEVGGFSLQEAIHTRQFWMLCIAFLGLEFCVQAIMVHIVPHAIDLRISAIIAATIITIIGGVSIAGRIIMGSAADRIGTRMAITICFVLLSATLLWLIAAKELWMLYLFAVIFGFGYGGLAALMSPTVAELFGLHAHGVILGAVTFSVTIGGAIGPLLTGRIFDVTNSYQLAFFICAVIAITGVILSILLRPTGSEGGRK